ncbi:MAG: hypothetical protein AAB360_00360 [Patescibacteria group bacterium]
MQHVTSMLRVGGIIVTIWFLYVAIQLEQSAWDEFILLGSFDLKWAMRLSTIYWLAAAGTFFFAALAKRDDKPVIIPWLMGLLRSVWRWVRPRRRHCAT